jgi:putative membrane protein insertion efficiency factor
MNRGEQTTEDRGGIASFRLLSFVLRLLIWLYRHSLSTFLGRNCRFLPTCSDYANEAIRIHGPIQGSALALSRFCRCHPWGGSGFDPVPEKEARGQRLEARDK